MLTVTYLNDFQNKIKTSRNHYLDVWLEDASGGMIRRPWLYPQVLFISVVSRNYFRTVVRLTTTRQLFGGDPTSIGYTREPARRSENYLTI